jgi:cytochrome c5
MLKNKYPLLLGLAILVLILAACGTSAPQATQPSAPAQQEQPTQQEEPAQPEAEATSAPADTSLVSFSQDVLPIFEEYCTKCHGETRQRGGVALNNYAAVQASDVIVLQDSAKSLLVRVLVSGEMPDDGPALDAGLIQTISDWIDAGAPDN